MDEMTKNKKHNSRLFPLYKMLSWDLLFFYAISYLFLSDVKGFSTAEIVFADAFYPIFKVLLQIPCTILIDKIGKRNSLIVANTSISIFVLLNIGCNSIFVLILSNLFCAFGFVIKGIAESNILYETIPPSQNRQAIFSKKDGRSGALFYYFDAITSVASGFLYLVNPYIPFVCCLIMSILSTFISYQFRIIDDSNSNQEIDSSGEYISKDKNIKTSKYISNYLKDLFIGFKYIFRSARLRSLILFNGIFSAFVCELTTIRRSLMSIIGFDSTQFGITFAVLGILCGISSSKSLFFHKKMKNKALTYIGLYFTFSVIIGSAILLLDMPYIIKVTIFLIMIGIQFLLKGPYYTLIKQYLFNFSTSSMRIKIYSASTFIEGICSALLAFLISFMLEQMESTYVSLILGIVIFIILVILLSYMKKHVGLKPDEYKSNDINIGVKGKDII